MQNLIIGRSSRPSPLSPLSRSQNTRFLPEDFSDNDRDFELNWTPPSSPFQNTRFLSKDFSDDDSDFEVNWTPPSPPFQNARFLSKDFSNDNVFELNRAPSSPPFGNTRFLSRDFSEDNAFELNRAPSSPPFGNTRFPSRDFSEDNAFELNRAPSSPPFGNTRFLSRDFSEENTFELNSAPPSLPFENTRFHPDHFSEDDRDFELNYAPSLTMKQVRNAQYSRPQQYTIHSTPPLGRPLGRLTDADKLHESYIESLLEEKDNPITKEDLALLAQIISQRHKQAQQVQIKQAQRIHDLEGRERQQVGDNHTQEAVARTSGRRKPRIASTKELHKLIRKFAFTLMGRVTTGNKNPDPITSVVLPEIETFLKDPTNPTKGPRVDRFILDFNKGSGAGSPWNKKATVVFAEEFIQSHEHYTKEAISKAFKTHLFQLKNQFNVYTKYVADSSRMGNQAGILTSREGSAIHIARMGRRRGVLARRIHACLEFLHHPDIQKLQNIWAVMPIEAISGDETDHYHGAIRYIITTLPWRAPWIHEWMLVFDRLHLFTRFTDAGRATAGAFPHIRILGDTERVDRHCITPPVGLPSNFYCPDWLAKQAPKFIEGLQMLEPIDLSFSKDLIRIAATCKFVTSHQTPPLPLNHLLENADEPWDSESDMYASA